MSILFKNIDDYFVRTPNHQTKEEIIGNKSIEYTDTTGLPKTEQIKTAINDTLKWIASK